ncbi:MAG: type I-G CRISPR-associated protein Csb2 [Verrucomicrobiia bacterium]
MVLIEFTFPAKRLHTTPWDKQVNEGVVEWPPSPWRILRALISTWHIKCKNDVPEERFRGIIDKLTEKLPSYELPRASLGHTRHFMPTIEGPNIKKAKIFDTFVVVDGALKALWDIELSPEQIKDLELICGRLSYLGRAESVVVVCLKTNSDGFKPNAIPLAEDEHIPPGKEIVRLLTPMSASQYQTWKTSLEKTEPGEFKLEAGAKEAKKKRTSKKKKKDNVLPSDIFSALHADTADLEARGWKTPPGAKFIDYARPMNCFEVKRILGKIAEARPVVARFEIASAVMPRIVDAIKIAERVHRYILSRFKGEIAPGVLSGCDENKKPLTGHRHLHIFCEPCGKRDEITNITLFAEEGFGREEQAAIQSITKLWGEGGHDLQLVFLGFGDKDYFIDSLPFGESDEWYSLTPFVPTLHPKFYRDGRPKYDAEGWHIGSPEYDLRRLILESGKPLPQKIERLKSIVINGRELRWLQFFSRRIYGKGTSSGQPPVGFRIKFPEKLQGPLAFGYGAHFGMGMFATKEKLEAASIKPIRYQV